MPSFLDLTGRRFGKLLVIEQAGTTKCETKKALWLCQCDCGTRETYPTPRLSQENNPRKIRSCSGCAAIRCVVCQNPFIPYHSQVITCSLECRKSKNLLRNQENQRKLAREKPEIKSAYHRKWLAGLDEEALASYRKRKNADLVRHKSIKNLNKFISIGENLQKRVRNE